MTEKRMGFRRMSRAAGYGAAVFLFLTGAASAAAWAQSQQPQYPVPGGEFPTAPQLQLPSLPTPQAITPNGQVVEDVIARVNDRIITRSEYERAEKGLLQEAEQQHESESDLDEHLHNLLRDMIDQQLLLSKGKELGITGDAETIRELDEIRKQNHLDSMEALQHAAEQQGVSFEDFKQSIRDRVISQQVVRDQVGRRINMTRAQEEAYYNAHKQDFAVPEQVHLSEILIPTPDNPTDAQVSAAQAKAEDAYNKLKGGASFAELAKSVSGGPTASAGGDLGDFKRGTLGQVLEDATFPLPTGGFTKPIRTRQGFVILRVDSHQQAGVPPLDKVEPEVQQALYMQDMQPALRAYLTKLRDEAYIDIKPGFTDSGADAKESKPTFTAYSKPKPKKKVLRKRRLEQEKEQQAAAALAEARERLRERQEAQAEEQAAKAGGKNVKFHAKHKKFHREKIRYGQAPRNSLPGASSVAVQESSGPLQGQAAGVAMAPTDSVTTISTGTGADINQNPLDQQAAAPDHKTRFSERQNQSEEKRDQNKLVKAEERMQDRPVQATPQETADEKHQAAPLGLNGDTAKKQKHKRKKGEPKERMQEAAQKKAEEEANKPKVAPTVNPDLTAPVTTPQQ